MKKAKKLTRNFSIKYQILLTMILLCLFPFLGLLFYMIHDSLSVIQNQSLSNEMKYLDKTRVYMESFKENTESYFTSKAVEEVFFSYCYNDLNFRSYTMLRNAQNELENFSYGQDIIRGSYFINFQKNFIIGSAFAGCFLPDISNPIEQAIHNTEFHQTAIWTYLSPWEGFQRPGKYPSLNLDGILLLIPYPLVSPSNQSAMVVSIDTKKLGEVLDPMDTSRQLLITNEDNVIIYSNTIDKMGHNIFDFISHQELLSTQKTGTIPIQNGTQKLSLSWIRDDSGWNYYSIVDLALANQEMYSLWNTAVFFGIFSLIILLLLIYFFSRRLYLPIYTIANKMRHLTEDDREKNEFQLITKGVDQYEEQLKRQKDSLKEFFFQKLMKDSFHSVSPSKMKEEAARIGLSLHNTDMVIIVFQILEINQSSPNPDVLAVEKIISTFPLDSMVTSTFYQGLFIVWMQNIPYRPQFMDKIQKGCQHVKQEMALTSYLFNIGVSPIFHEYNEVHKSYLAAVSNLCIDREGYSQVPTDSMLRNNEFLPEELCAQLAFSIQNGTEEETERLLSSLAKRIFHDTTDPSRQEFFLIWAASSIFSNVHHNVPLSYDLCPPHPLEILSRIHDSNTMQYYFMRNIIHPIKEWIKDKSGKQKHNLAEATISMIQKNFDTDLTLEYCADILHCHPMHLWQIFKDETNLTFSQYLENYRYHMARKWLLETDKPVSEIADLLRYSNAQNFIRSFKKKTGMTPGKFRQLNQYE